MTGLVVLRRSGSGRLRRAVTPTLALALSLDLTGCALRSYQPAPLTDISVPSADFSDRAFKLTTARGQVVLVRPTVAFPYVEGTAEKGDGRVELQLASVRGAREFADDKWTATLGTRLPLTPAAFAPAGGPRFVEFDTTLGKVRLAVVRVSETSVWGMPRGGKGRVRVDAREVTKLEVGEVSAPRGNWKTILVVVGVVPLAFFIAVAMSGGVM